MFPSGGGIGSGGMFAQAAQASNSLSSLGSGGSSFGWGGSAPQQNWQSWYGGTPGGGALGAMQGQQNDLAAQQMNSLYGQFGQSGLLGGLPQAQFAQQNAMNQQMMAPGSPVADGAFAPPGGMFGQVLNAQNQAAAQQQAMQLQMGDPQYQQSLAGLQNRNQAAAQQIAQFRMGQQQMAQPMARPANPPINTAGRGLSRAQMMSNLQAMRAGRR